MCLFHKWSKFKIERKDVLEMRDGFLFPYIIQKRECQKCGKFDIIIVKDSFEIWTKLRVLEE